MPVAEQNVALSAVPQHVAGDIPFERIVLDLRIAVAGIFVGDGISGVGHDDCPGGLLELLGNQSHKDAVAGRIPLVAGHENAFAAHLREPVRVCIPAELHHAVHEGGTGVACLDIGHGRAGDDFFVRQIGRSSEGFLITAVVVLPVHQGVSPAV